MGHEVECIVEVGRSHAYFFRWRADYCQGLHIRPKLYPFLHEYLEAAY